MIYVEDFGRERRSQRIQMNERDRMEERWRNDCLHH
jgi:hypothetical protein